MHIACIAVFVRSGARSGVERNSLQIFWSSERSALQFVGPERGAERGAERTPKILERERFFVPLRPDQFFEKFPHFGQISPLFPHHFLKIFDSLAHFYRIF